MAGWVGLRNGWMGGFAKADNGFGYEKWLQGECIGLALLRSKKKRGKNTLSLTSPEKEKYFFYIRVPCLALI
jgi:hypothetical protein